MSAYVRIKAMRALGITPPPIDPIPEDKNGGDL